MVTDLFCEELAIAVLEYTRIGNLAEKILVARKWLAKKDKLRQKAVQLSYGEEQLYFEVRDIVADLEVHVQEKMNHTLTHIVKATKSL